MAQVFEDDVVFRRNVEFRKSVFVGGTMTTVHSVLREETPFEEIRDEIAEANPDAILFDGFEDALIGSMERFQMPPLALYDYEACISILEERDGMDRETAVEFLDYNTLGVWAGEHTPAFAHLRK